MNEKSNERKIDLEEIRALVQIASEAEITELSVETEHLKVSIKKAPPAAAGQPIHAASGPPPAPSQAAPHLPAAEEAEEAKLVPIVAPMVGTFYRAPSPDAPPFVEVGERVEKGQTVCIIEAMKLFNEIPAEVEGRIVKVLAENGQPVEYGQPLFLVEPS
ncbi:MAG: acetyl-CoA carboxylase biotin carboxyl carrier protein [Armatimonadota bacterium]|nr:acetyl-CoA carboxylase biotin carboxyl carrier protein [Armatimonadota bacterium]MDR5702618.1 acetyl-CoA carboxylase biotin carboxyl carrier protein [Armatimonadota bacterium]